MAIGLTPEEILLLQGQAESGGEILDAIESLTFQIAQLQLQKIKLGLDSTTYEKFYNWWTLLTGYSELEEKWSFGHYVSSPLDSTTIEQSAIGEDTILFPYSAESWAHLYPKRIDALNGTDSTGYNDTTSSKGPYEWGEIQNEQDSTAPAWLAPVQAQIAALETYIIPNITSFISECQSEPDYSSVTDPMVTAATTSLAAANAALTDASAAEASHPTYPPTRATSIAARKTAISTRVSWIDANHDDLYDKRYLWLDFMINRSYGVTGDYLTIDDTIAILTAEKTALENRLIEIQAVI